MGGTGGSNNSGGEQPNGKAGDAGEPGTSGNPGAKGSADSPEVAGGFLPLSLLTLKSSKVPTSATVGKSYSGSASVTGGTAPYSWQAFGLPAGLTFASGTGKITGTPTVAGTFPVELVVSDSSTGAKAVSEKTVILTIAAKA